MASSPAKTAQLQLRVTAQQKSAIRRAARRAGMDMSSWLLSRALPRPSTVFAELVEQLGRRRDRPSYALAEINDWLAGLSAAELAIAIADAPAVELGAYLGNYLAAMVEVAAHRRRIPSPAWTAEVQPLEAPVFGSPLLGLRLWLLVHSPPPFRRRNIFIDASVGDRV